MNGIQSVSMIAVALASILGCYTVSLHAANERTAVAAAHDRIAHDLDDMRLLRAELLTRSRQRELQRWNEQVLALAPPVAEQLLANPVLLAAYAAPKTAGPPAAGATVATVVRDAPVQAPVLQPASFVPQPAHDLGTDAAVAGAAVVKASFRKVALQ